MAKSNYEQIMSLGVNDLATVIFNISEDYCAFCPLNMTRNCNENCRAGIQAWLRSEYIAGSEVWKGKRR